MPSTPLAFTDTETTGLDPRHHHVWEIAVIRRGQDTEVERLWQVRPDLTTADPEGLEISRFNDRFAVPDGCDAIDGLRALMEQDAVFVFTSRNISHVTEWLQQHGFDAIADSTITRRVFWDVRGMLLVTDRKYPATAYLDDRAVRFENWDQALAALKAIAKGGPDRLLECGLCYEEAGEEVHPHPECAVGTRARAEYTASQFHRARVEAEEIVAKDLGSYTLVRCLWQRFRNIQLGAEPPLPTDNTIRHSRRFVVRHPDHPDLHGVEFPSGRCIADDLNAGLTAAVSPVALLEGTDGRATVHWADETAEEPTP